MRAAFLSLLLTSCFYDPTLEVGEEVIVSMLLSPSLVAPSTKTHCLGTISEEISGVEGSCGSLFKIDLIDCPEVGKHTLARACYLKRSPK